MAAVVQCHLTTGSFDASQAGGQARGIDKQWKIVQPGRCGTQDLV